MIQETKRNNEIIPESELIINSKGNVYHLDINKNDICKNIILVGDPERVPLISKNFESIRFKNTHREFVIHTGFYKGKEFTVISTGIGVDNIDIVLNECDAVFNIDLKTRQIKKEKSKLSFVRIGTSGSLHSDIQLGSFVVSKYALGFGNLLNYYNYKNERDELLIREEVYEQLHLKHHLDIHPYVAKGCAQLINLLSNNATIGITATAVGFFGPQGRSLRLQCKVKDLNKRLQHMSIQNLRIINFEMETSALYGLAGLLEHSACTICTIIANRDNKHVNIDSEKSMTDLIDYVLNKICLH